MRRRDVIDVDLLFMKKIKEERNYDMIVMVNYFCNIIKTNNHL
jgi:isocitrate/isopropylmalate dehydrogenase